MLLGNTPFYSRRIKRMPEFPRESSKEFVDISVKNTKRALVFYNPEYSKIVKCLVCCVL